MSAGTAKADPESVQELCSSEAARKVAQLFALDRLNKRELAVVHPVLAALAAVRCALAHPDGTGLQQRASEGRTNRLRQQAPPARARLS